MPARRISESLMVVSCLLSVLLSTRVLQLRVSIMLKRLSVFVFPVLLLASVTLTLSSQAQAKSWLESGGDFLDSLLGGEESSPVKGALSSADISDGLKEALEVGTERVVSQLGQTNGFNGDELIHIPLPSQLK